MFLFISLMVYVSLFLCPHQKLKSIQPCMCIRINSRSDIQIIMKVQVQIWYCQRIVILCFQKEKRSHSTKSCKPHSDEPNFVCTQQRRSRYVPIGKKNLNLTKNHQDNPSGGTWDCKNMQLDQTFTDTAPICTRWNVVEEIPRLEFTADKNNKTDQSQAQPCDWKQLHLPLLCPVLLLHHKPQWAVSEPPICWNHWASEAQRIAYVNPGQDKNNGERNASRDAQLIRSNSGHDADLSILVSV